MKTESKTCLCISVLILLAGVFFSTLMMFGGGRFVSGDIVLFFFMTFLACLARVLTGKSVEFKPSRIPSAHRHMSSRKYLCHRNDPLLM